MPGETPPLQRLSPADADAVGALFDLRNAAFLEDDPAAPRGRRGPSGPG